MRAMLAVCLVGLLSVQACAVRRSASGVTYTPLGVAQKTFREDVPTVLRAVHQALGTLDMPVREVRSVEEGGQPVRTEMVAVARDRRITVTVERVADKRTRVDVDVRRFLVKDRATATAILVQASENLPQ